MQLTEQPTNNSSTIMVVDDNPMNLMLLDRILSNAGHQVLSMEQCANVIDACESNQPDMVLLDINMPEMNGCEVCAQLKSNQNTSDIPVIFISALSDPNEKVKALSTGGVDYITKPFQAEEVLTRIDIHLKLRKLQKELEEKNAALEKEIQRRIKAEQKLIIQATTDPLTNIYNRRCFFDLATQELSRARRGGGPFTVLMLDIDHFKELNDTYGHLVGDQVLRKFANLCRKYLRDYDLLARYGGEEFVAILSNTDKHKAKIIAERLRSKIAKTKMKIGDLEIWITVSLGICWFNGETEISLAKLLDRADNAMYRSKQTGRNRVTIWEG